MILSPHLGPSLDEIVILILDYGRNSDTNPGFRLILCQFLGRDNATNPSIYNLLAALAAPPPLAEVT